MDWDSLLRSAVLAALISSVVAGIGFWVSSKTAQKINADKLKLDKELAEHKALAERELTQRKFELDRELSIAKRKAEVAEHVLACFYRLRRAFEIIRSPAIWANEIIPEEGVPQDIIENDGYSVMRRMRQYDSLFAELESLRFTYGALFGAAATEPFDHAIRLQSQVFHAAQHIMQYRHEQNAENLRGHLRNMRRIAFALTQLDDDGNETPDRTAEMLLQIIGRVEADCQPALASALAAEAIGRQA